MLEFRFFLFFFLLSLHIDYMFMNDVELVLHLIIHFTSWTQSNSVILLTPKYPTSPNGAPI